MPASRTARLIRLATEVRTNPTCTPEALCETLGVSKAQLYKDRAALAGIGFRFRYRRDLGRYEVEADPFVPVYNFSLTELLALTVAVGQISAAGDYTLTYEALRGLRRVLSESPADLRQVLLASLNDVVLREGFGCDPEVLEDLHRATMEHRRVVVFYVSAKDRQGRRHVLDPCRIYFKRRALYLDAYDVEARAYRFFRLNRVRRVETTGVTLRQGRSDYSFHRLHRGSFDVFAGERLEQVRVRFSPHVAFYIREVLWHPSQEITDLPDGGILFQVTVNYPKEVIWWAAQWGPEAEVLEPPEARAYAAEMAKGMAGVYEKDGPIGGSL